MALTTEQRKELYSKFQRIESSNRTEITVSKTELSAAVDAIDDWIDANSVSFNDGIPQPARANLKMKQKLRIFMSILKTRWEVE